MRCCYLQPTRFLADENDDGGPNASGKRDLILLAMGRRSVTVASPCRHSCQRSTSSTSRVPRSAGTQGSSAGGSDLRRLELEPERHLTGWRQGIAQFMPGTARGYELMNPFDPAAAMEVPHSRQV